MQQYDYEGLKVRLTRDKACGVNNAQIPAGHIPADVLARIRQEHKVAEMITSYVIGTHELITKN